MVPDHSNTPLILYITFRSFSSSWFSPNSNHSTLRDKSSFSFSQTTSRLNITLVTLPRVFAQKVSICLLRGSPSDKRHVLMAMVEKVIHPEWKLTEPFLAFLRIYPCKFLLTVSTEHFILKIVSMLKPFVWFGKFFYTILIQPFFELKTSHIKKISVSITCTQSEDIFYNYWVILMSPVYSNYKLGRW